MVSQANVRVRSATTRSEAGPLAPPKCRRRTTKALAAIAGLLAGNGPALAQDAVPAEQATAARPVSFEVGTGVQYDSNVAVLDLDTSANAGDAAALLDLGIGYDKPRTGRLGVQAGYHFSQTLHEDFDEFNVAIHRGSASVNVDLAPADTGVMLQYAHALLDGEEFLVLTQASPFVSKLVGEKLFLRFAYAHTDKDFATSPGRDAKAGSVSADAFVFLDGLKSYLMFGVRYDDEDALDGQFDYSGSRMHAQWSRRMPFGARELTFKANLRYETRDYDRPTVSIGVPRGDDRYQLEAIAQLPLTERLLTKIGYKHADNRSNLPSVDFDEDVFSVSFAAGF